MKNDDAKSLSIIRTDTNGPCDAPVRFICIFKPALTGGSLERTGRASGPFYRFLNSN